MIDQVQLVAPQILDRGRVGRAPKKGSQLSYRTKVVALCLVRELAHPHVVEYALAQRRDGMRRCVHGFCSCRDARRIASFHNINRSSVPTTTDTRSELNYRASGLVRRPTGDIR